MTQKGRDIQGECFGWERDTGNRNPIRTAGSKRAAHGDDELAEKFEKIKQDCIFIMQFFGFLPLFRIPMGRFFLN